MLVNTLGIKISIELYFFLNPSSSSSKIKLELFGARAALQKVINELLWTPAQRKRASMLYFANVFLLFFYGRLILRPWLTEVRESFTRGGP